MDYFITFRTYGTWLHGDERGSVDKKHNDWGEPVLEKLPHWKNHARSQLRGETVTLDAAQRQCVEITIREVAQFRQWSIHTSYTGGANQSRSCRRKRRLRA